MRQNQSLPWASALPSGAIPLAGVPIKVTTSVDDKRAASADIGPKGGLLSLTDAGGNKFTLTIPPSAMFATEKIVMTPVTAAQGVPGRGLISVQLAPDGLVLLRPATLVIQPASASAGTLTPVGWYGSGRGVYLNPLLPKASQLTMLISHFSYGGASSFTAGDLTSVLLNMIDLKTYNEAEQVAVLTDARANGGITPPEFFEIFDAQWADVIEPLIEIALASQDDDAIRCAMQYSLGYERQRELLGYPLDEIKSAIDEFQSTGIDIMIGHAEKRCKVDHDFTALEDLLGLYRQAQLLGSTVAPDISALQQACPNRLQLEFTSQIETLHTPGLGAHYKGQISAKFPLTGKFDKDVLTEVKDPSKDLFASYMMSGSGLETYDNFSFVAPPCTIAVNQLRPGTMTVAEKSGDNKSQVQFIFSAAYDPVAKSRSGVQLCAFCPIHQRKPVKVELLMDAGLVLEDLTASCPGSVDKILQTLWSHGWEHVHPSASTTVLISLPSGNSLPITTRLPRRKASAKEQLTRLKA